jgi:esterase/lipase superfamily enzyme
MADPGTAFVFIHGYNTTFEDAARRTAQIAYDTNFQGAPILYSWPSRGAYWGYVYDMNSIEWSTFHLKSVLADVAKMTEAKTIHVIAHSMGNVGLTAALQRLVTELPAEQQDKFNQIVLAAPDIDAAVFESQIAPDLIHYGQIILYASSRDGAMQAAKSFYGYPRLGDVGPDGPLVISGIESIDASGIRGGDLFQHAYVFNASVILRDLRTLLLNYLPPDQRGLECGLLTTGVCKYWRFIPAN